MDERNGGRRIGYGTDKNIDTMSLLRLCHAGRPKTLAFTSSISTCMGPGQTSLTVPEEPIGSDPTVALTSGYAQSKYIGTSTSLFSLPLFPHHIAL